MMPESRGGKVMFWGMFMLGMMSLLSLKNGPAVNEKQEAFRLLVFLFCLVVVVVGFILKMIDGQREEG